MPEEEHKEERDALIEEKEGLYLDLYGYFRFGRVSKRTKS